ncbi:hypothetical protein P3X46_006796 [Hevea brasiliensis]|uniref:Uncharacterized protein n=1 Tax=Hevea brasiliensis TaxID=3981 RepID=A0ABQ9MRC9_HEVBR|nr:hypothetical protein P3X46_006796 [Hevea brasiliensis]
MRRAKKTLLALTKQTTSNQFQVMALSLYSSIINSQKLSVSVSIVPSIQKHRFLSTHFAFRLNQARAGVTPRPGHLKFHCKSTKNYATVGFDSVSHLVFDFAIAVSAL